MARDVAMIVGGSCENAWADSSPEARRALLSGSLGQSGSQTRRTSIESQWDRYIAAYGEHGGDRQGYYNLFRPEFEITNQALSQNGWEVEIQYGEGQSWQRPWVGSGTASFAALTESLRRWTRELQNNDQFLLTINTHGSPAPHYVCLGNDRVQVSDLVPYLRSMSGKGIKVAVIDDSCFSGNTVEEFRDLDICTLSATTSHQTGAAGIGYGIFGLGLTPEQIDGHSVLDDLQFQHTSIFTGNPRGLSLQEAFDYSQIIVSPDAPTIPLSSDCVTRNTQLYDDLQSMEGLLRSEFYLKQYVSGNSSNLVDIHFTQVACQIDAVSEDFYQILGLSTSVSRALAMENRRQALNAVENSMRRMGLRNFTMNGFMADYERTVEDYIQEHRYVGNNDSRVQARQDRLQRDLRVKIRTLLALACMLDRSLSPGQGRQQCHDFRLFNLRGAQN